MSLLDKQEVQYIGEHTALSARKWSGFICKRTSGDTTLSGYEKIRRKKKNVKSCFFYFARCVRKLRYYSDVILSFD